jgi:hypothetical protein
LQFYMLFLKPLLLNYAAGNVPCFLTTYGKAVRMEPVQ